MPFKKYVLFFIVLFLSACEKQSFYTRTASPGEDTVPNTTNDLDPDPSPSVIPNLKVAKLVISGPISGSLLDFGTQSVTSINEVTLTVKNEGEQTATAIDMTTLSAPFYYRGGTCGTSLKGGASCQLVVRYVPTSTANSVSNLNLRYYNGEENKQEPVSLKGVGSYVASVRLSRNATTYEPLTGPLVFGPLAPGGSQTIELTLYYFGSRPASGVTFLGLNNAFTVTETCPTEMTSKCSVSIKYQSPGAGTSTSQTLYIKYFNSDYSDETSLAVTGSTDTVTIPAALSLSGTTSFGRYLVGKTPTTTISVNYSSGNVPAVIDPTSFITLTNQGGESAFSVGTKSCGTRVDGANPCSFTIQFAPTDATKLYTATLSISYGDGVGTPKISNTLTLTGSGGNKPVLTFTATNGTDFGGESVSCAKELNFTISNNGTNPITANSLSFALAAGSNASFSKQNGSSSNCGTTLGGGGSCNIKIRFTPNAATSGLAATINVNYADDGGTTINKTLPIAVTGNGLSTPKIALSSTTQNFGTAFTDGAAVTRSFSITYCGTTPVSFVSADVTGTNADFFSFPNGFPGTGASNPACSTSSLSANCNLFMQFKPVSTTNGTKTATLTLNYSNAGTPMSPLVASLSGTATHTPATLTILEAGAMGRTPRGVSVDKTFTLRNNSTVLAKTITFSALSAPFTIVQNNCTNSGGTFDLPASQSCTFNVRFNSGTAGDYGTRLTVSYLDPSASKSVPLDLSASAIVPISVSINGHHTCMITDKAAVKCWGLNAEGQLGIGNSSTTSAPGTPVTFGSGVPSVLALGYFHSCLLLEDGKVKCWGRNTEGQLGNGNNANVGGASPAVSVAANTFVNLGGNAQAITAGYHFTCALLDTGVVKCWGYNGQGQLGAGDSVSRNTPVAVDLGGKAVSVLAHGGSACAKLENGSLKCWGDNFFGQLGTGIDVESIGNHSNQMGNNLPAVILPNGTSVSHYSVGNGFSCAVTSDGATRCWGKNDSTGNLGHLYCQNSDAFTVGLCSNAASFPDQIDWIGRKVAEMNALVPVNWGSDFAVERIQSGHFYTCAQSTAKKVKCFGNNSTGTLGLGNTTSRGTLASQMGDALPLLDFGANLTLKRLEVGDTHNCVILVDSSNIERLKCWGENQYGQLGINNYTNMGQAPNQMGSNLPMISF